MREVFFIVKAVIRPGINLMAPRSTDDSRTLSASVTKINVFFCPEIFFSVVLAFKVKKTLFWCTVQVQVSKHESKAPRKIIRLYF